MAESQRVVSGNIGGENFSVFKTNATTYRLAMSGKISLNPRSGA